MRSSRFIQYCLLIYAVAAPARAAPTEDDSAALTAPSIHADLQLNEYYQSLRQKGIDTWSDLSDQWLQADITLNEDYGNYRAEAQDRLWLTRGSSRSLPITDPFGYQILLPKRLVNLSWRINETSTPEFVSDMERLGLKWERDNVEIFVGRRPVSLGALTFFRIWNQFNYVQGEPPWVFSDVYGSDSVSFSYQTGELWSPQSRAAFHYNTLMGGDRQHDAHLLESVLYFDGGEAHLLTGRWWDSWAAGLSTVWDASGWALRTEHITHWIDNVAGSQSQVGVGAERALDENWTLLMEGYYQTTGYGGETAPPGGGHYSFAYPSEFTPYRAKGYALGRLSWAPGPLWKFEAGPLVNLIDGSRMILLHGNRSLTENIDLYGSAFLPWGNDSSEFSSKTVILAPTVYAGVGPQILAGIKASF